MRGSSPARITIWCLRLMDMTPASQAGNMGSTPVGITKVFKWNCSSRVECGPGKPRDAGSSPVSSTIQKKSELIPNRERVRISYLHQRYYILSLCPPGFALRTTGGFVYSTKQSSFGTIIASTKRRIAYGNSVHSRWRLLYSRSDTAGRTPPHRQVGTA